jgi:hypothetical protein
MMEFIVCCIVVIDHRKHLKCTTNGTSGSLFVNSVSTYQQIQPCSCAVNLDAHGAGWIQDQCCDLVCR